MLYVLGSCRVAFPLLQWRSFLTSQLSTKVLTILGNTSLEKTPLTAASYNIALSSHKWKCRKEPAAQQRSFSNYPRGYWGATVIACDAETEEWVLRFDEAYGDLWDAGSFPRPLQGFIPASQIGQSSQERGRDSYTGGGQGRAIPEFHAQQALPPNSGTYNPLISTPRQVCTSAVNKILWKCQSYRGQMFMETLTKEDKKMIQELKNEISQAETAVVPTSLAFAIFRFDLGELFK
jgi:hypothetical protein